MCFYTASSKRALSLAKRYGRKTDIIEITKEILEEQYRVTAFTNPTCPIITDNQSIEAAKWGLIPRWTKTAADAVKFSKMCLNARSETVFELPSFRNPIISKRCLIPVTGYFEFHHHENSAIPYYIFLKDEEIFSLGGLYEHWTNPATQETTQTFTILTVAANNLCTQIHNGGKNPFRMPLIINREDENHWLDKSFKTNDIKQFFKSFDDNLMDAHPIANDFLKKNPDDATIIEPARLSWGRRH